MNNLLNLDNLNLPEDPDKVENGDEPENSGEPEVKYWAFGSTWQDMDMDKVDELAENGEQFNEWLKDKLAPDVELAETILACMVVKNDPENGNYTIALWTDGHVNVESNDGEKRSVEHAVEIVLTEEVSEFFKRALEIIEHALEVTAFAIDEYSGRLRESGVDLKLLGELTADPDTVLERLKKAVADPKEYLK